MLFHRDLSLFSVIFLFSLNSSCSAFPAPPLARVER
jgi:hypothetical protein